MPTTTPRMGLTKPDIGNTTVWGVQTNTDWDLVDAQVELLVNKGVANGYASLDGSGKVPASELPTSVGGLDTQVQFNQSGVLAGSANFTWDYINNTLGVVSTSRAAATIQLDTTLGGAGLSVQTTDTDGGGFNATTGFSNFVEEDGSTSVIAGLDNQLNVTGFASNGTALKTRLTVSGVIANATVLDIGINISGTVSNLIGLHIADASNGGSSTSRAILVDGGISEFRDQTLIGPPTIQPLITGPSITSKPIFSYGASGIQRLTLGDIDSHYFGDNLEILHVFQDYNETQANTNFPNAIEGHARFNGATVNAPNGSIRAAFFVFENVDTHKIGSGIGLEGDAVTSLGDAAQLIGVSSAAGVVMDSQASRSVVVDEVIGGDFVVSAFVDISTAGPRTSTVTLATGVHVLGDASSQSTIGEWRGVHIEAPTTDVDDGGPGGTITLRKGLLIGDYSANNNDRAILVEGGITELRDLIVKDQFDSSKTITFDLSGLSPATAWLLTFPDANSSPAVDTPSQGGKALASFDVTTGTFGFVSVGTGSVTNFTAGNLAPLFTTNVATPSTTPALTFTLSNAGAHQFLGNNTGSPAAPAYVQPAFTDISGTATSAQIPNLDASKITTGVLALARGGNTFALLGDLIYGGVAAAPTVLSGNTTSTKQYLSQTGTGTVSAAPAWATIAAGDITGLAAIATSGKWSDLQNATAALTLANGTNNTTFNQTSAATWTWANTTAATNTVSQSSPFHSFNGTYWDGANSQTDSWTIQDVVANGTNGTSTLAIVHAGSSGRHSFQLDATTFLQWGTGVNGPGNPGNVAAGFALTSGVQNGSISLYTSNGSGAIFTLFNGGTSVYNFQGTGFTAAYTAAQTWLWDNTTAATNTTSQSSPITSYRGRYWDGAASQTDAWTVQNVVANGTNGTSQLTFTHTGSSGVASVMVPAGNTTTASAWGLGFNGQTVGFSASGNVLAIMTSGTGADVRWSVGGGSNLLGQIQAGTTRFNINAALNGSQLSLAGGTANGAAGIVSVLIGNESQNNGAMSATSGTAVAVQIGLGATSNTGAVRFNPTSGNAKFIGLNINPSINQTSTATGDYTALQVNVVETALLGTNKLLLDLQAGVSGGVSRYSIDNAGQQTEKTANGATWTWGQNSELLTLSTVGLTTDTTANLLPAGAIIEAVVCRVTTTITTTTNWAVGDSAQSARFSSPNATLTAGTTSIGLNQADPTVASSNLGPVQVSAAKVRITCTGSNPGAGVIRITVFFRQFVAPTS